MKPLSGGGSPGRPVSAVKRFLRAWKPEPAADLQDDTFPTDEIANLHPGASKAPVAFGRVWNRARRCSSPVVRLVLPSEPLDPRWPSWGRYRLTGSVLLRAAAASAMSVYWSWLLNRSRALGDVMGSSIRRKHIQACACCWSIITVRGENMSASRETRAPPPLPAHKSTHEHVNTHTRVIGPLADRRATLQEAPANQEQTASATRLTLLPSERSEVANCVCAVEMSVCALWPLFGTGPGLNSQETDQTFV